MPNNENEQPRPFSLAPRPPEIGPLDGFSKSDIFEAKRAGERLANIVGDLAGHSVIVLDGRWGSGKSIFAKQWAGLLRQRGHPVVEFDAFEHDHLDDPFFALFGAILRASSGQEPKLDGIKTRLIAKAAPMLRAIPSIAANVALRELTRGLISLDDFRGGFEAAETSAGDSIHAVIDSRLAEVSAQVACVQEFREALGDTVADATASETEKAPLVFIVDELDRCRPSYALRLLERMKHVFAAEGVCFVLVTHLEGLTAMVRREYGLQEADRYLDKFYQVRFDIQRILTGGERAAHLRYLDYLGEVMNLSRNDIELVSISINNLVRIYDLNFRSHERVMQNLSLFHRAGGAAGRDEFVEDPGAQEGRLVLAAGLCVMRELEPTLYRQASHGRLDLRRAVKFLQFERWTGVSQMGVERIEWYWESASADGPEHTAGDRERAPGEVEIWRQHLGRVCEDIDQLWQ